MGGADVHQWCIAGAARWPWRSLPPFRRWNNPDVHSGNRVPAEDSLPASLGTRCAHGRHAGWRVRKKAATRGVVWAPEETGRFRFPSFLWMENSALLWAI